jgi:hypothetical protein
MMPKLWHFGSWPSRHDMDLVVDHEISAAAERLLPFADSDYGTVVRHIAPTDLPELAPYRPIFADLLGRYGVPLDVFLDYRPDFNPALWITPGCSTWELSWRHCSRYFFDGVNGAVAS